MDKKIIRNYIYNMIYQITTLVIPMVITPYLARTLGEEGSGQYAYAYSILTYFLIFAALGFKNYGQRAIAFNQDNRKEMSVVFWELFFAKAISSLVALGVYVMFFYYCEIDDRYYAILCVMSFEIIAVIFDISYLFQGIEEFGKLAVRNIFIKILNLLLVLIFVKCNEHLIRYVIIQVAMVSVGNILLWWKINEYIEYVPMVELNIWHHFPATLVLFLPTIATSVYTSLDKTLIGIITKNDAENGNYDYSEKIVKMVMSVVTSLGTVVTPHNSKLFAEKKYEFIKDNIYKACIFVFFLGMPLMFGCIAVSDIFIPSFLGEAYEESIYLMKIFAPLIMIIGISNVYGLQYLVPSKKDKEFTIAILIGAISNFAMNVFFIKLYGAYGAAFASVIAELLVTAVMYAYIRKEIDFLIIWKKTWKFSFSSVVMFLIIKWVTGRLESNYWSIIIITFVGSVVYFGVLLLLRENLIMTNLEKMKKKRG